MLKPIEPGLRRIHHDANSVAKVELVVAADDVLHVSEDVAAQLTKASRQFKDVTDETPAAPEADGPSPAKASRVARKR